MLPRVYLGTPTCTECGAELKKWDQLPDGKWVPINPDGSLHRCDDDENGGVEEHIQETNQEGSSTVPVRYEDR